MKPKMESNTASVAVIGVDIGKDVFHLVGLGADGKIAFRRKIRRLGLHPGDLREALHERAEERLQRCRTSENSPS